MKGAVNTSGMLAGLPNYAIIPLKKEAEIEMKNLPSRKEMESMTP